ncbi:MAG: hypothetical protein ACRD88_13825 [Terriglobia bacterium]
MTALEDWMYGVAVRHDAGLRLLCCIKRAREGDIYYLIPRKERGWNPHVSYHRDGKRFVKSYDGKVLVSKVQRPDKSFRGTEGLFAMAIQPRELPLLETPCVADKFSEVFEITRDQFPPEELHTLAVDLVEPGYSTIPFLGKEAIAQRTFRDASPWILVTLWRGTFL